MRHDLALRGHAFGLRPVTLEDAALIVTLRAPAGAAGYLNRGAATDAAQRAWLERYFQQPGDYYFVVYALAEDRPEGLAGIYAIDPERACGEWGRWVLRPGSRAAVESALLVYRCAFECLGLGRVIAHTLAGNAQVVSFHDSCGLARAEAPIMITVDGQPRAAIEHVLTRERWPAVEARLERLARRDAARTGRSGAGGNPA